jgi:uncharacterized protein
MHGRVGAIAATWVLAAGLHTAAAGEATFPDPPAPERFHRDEAGLIRADEGRELDRIAAELLDEEQVALIVVTIDSLAAHGAAGYTIERYADALFDQWGIGSQARNYGMLLLVSRGDRRARIELGAEWGRTHDSQAQEVMDTLILPEFRRGSYAEGILAGVRGLDAMARGLQLPRPAPPWWALPLLLGLAAAAIAVVISLFRSGRSGWGWALLAALAALLFVVMRSAGQKGGSSDAFDGGSSSGGGASGRW